MPTDVRWLKYNYYVGTSPIMKHHLTAALSLSNHLGLSKTTIRLPLSETVKEITSLNYFTAARNSLWFRSKLNTTLQLVVIIGAFGKRNLLPTLWHPIVETAVGEEASWFLHCSWLQLTVCPLAKTQTTYWPNNYTAHLPCQVTLPTTI